MTAKRRPCPTCPWRKSTPRGGFPGGLIDVERLVAMTRDDLGAIMQCHCTPDGERAQVCVGFGLVVGPECLAYRFAVICGRIEHDAMEASCELHSLASLIATHGGRAEVEVER